MPLYVIPVEPGRNISLLVEVAALTQRLRNQGRNPATELNKILIERIQNRAASPRRAMTPPAPGLTRHPASPPPDSQIVEVAPAAREKKETKE